MNEHEGTEPVWTDPIVAEVRQAREELFAAVDYDLARLCQKLRAEQAQSGHRLVRRAPKPPEDLPGAA